MNIDPIILLAIPLSRMLRAGLKPTMTIDLGYKFCKFKMGKTGEPTLSSFCLKIHGILEE